LLRDTGTFARELHDFSHLEPADASPIAATEAQEFFYPPPLWWYSQLEPESAG
jgi:hypothetical protein